MKRVGVAGGTATTHHATSRSVRGRGAERELSTWLTAINDEKLTMTHSALVSGGKRPISCPDRGEDVGSVP